MIYAKKLKRLSLFNAINRTDLDAESAESAAPVIDVVILAIRDDGRFRANQSAIIAGNAN